MERYYTTYLVCVALAGWSLASYDFNLLVLTFPDIAKSLNLAPSAIGLLGFIIYAAIFIITFLAGWRMDQYGRKWMWMFCLTAAAVFTGVTYFVQNYAELAVVRALASGFANSELAISITLVNEQVPSARRGFLYSIVQGGWPVGVFLASGVYLLFNHLGWRMVFVFGVVPIICVILGRFWVKESDRFEHLRAVRAAAGAGDRVRVERLLTRYKVDVAEVTKVTLRQLFGTPGHGAAARRFIDDGLAVLCDVLGRDPRIYYVLADALPGLERRRRGAAAADLRRHRVLFLSAGRVAGRAVWPREVLVWTGIVTGPLNLAFMFVQAPSRWQ